MSWVSFFFLFLLFHSCKLSNDKQTTLANVSSPKAEDSSSSSDEDERDDEYETLAEKRQALEEAQEEYDQAWEETYDD